MCVGEGDNLYDLSDDGYISVNYMWHKLHRTASPGGMPDSPKKLARSPGPPPPPPLFLSAFFSAPLSFFLSFLPGMVRGPRGGKGVERRGEGGEGVEGVEGRGGGEKGWII